MRMGRVVGVVGGGMLAIPAWAQTVTQEFADLGYAVVDLGSAPGVPANYGGLTVRPEEPDVLYLGGAANGAAGAVYRIGVERDPTTGTITGFVDTAEVFAPAPDVDGGVLFAPNGTLFYTRYSNNILAQRWPDGTVQDTSLGPLGVASSTGSAAFVPQGFPGAGGLIVSSYNGSALYRLPFTLDGDGGRTCWRRRTRA